MSETFNALTQRGRIVRDPRFVVSMHHACGQSPAADERYGQGGYLDDKGIVEGLAWQASVTIGQFPAWVLRHRYCLITVEDHGKLLAKADSTVPPPVVLITYPVWKWHHEPACGFCAEPELQEDCTEHCHKSENGEHNADLSTVAYASHEKGQCIVDINCRLCGQSGAASFRDEDIQW